jgi:hypothetical protein
MKIDGWDISTDKCISVLIFTAVKAVLMIDQRYRKRLPMLIMTLPAALFDRYRWLGFNVKQAVSVGVAVECAAVAGQI